MAANGNRGGISRAAAKAFWLALPPEKRTMKAVADRFRVTAGRISQIASEDRWAEALADVEREIDERGVKAAIRSQSDLAAGVRRILSLLINRILAGLEAGETIELRDALRRLPEIVRVDQLLAGEASDRIEVAEFQPVLVAVSQVAIIAGRERWEPERTLEALREATAGLVPIAGTAAA